MQGFGMAGFYLEFMRIPVLETKEQPSSFFDLYSAFAYFSIVIFQLFLNYPLIVSLTDLTSYQCITCLVQVLRRYKNYLATNMLLGNNKLFIKMKSW